MHLLAILFFAGVVGACVALLWTTIDEHKALILANLPWRTFPPEPTILAIRRVSYCATPSSSSETPVFARIVSPATVR
jgi:hypothetical protein